MTSPMRHQIFQIFWHETVPKASKGLLLKTANTPRSIYTSVSLMIISNQDCILTMHSSINDRASDQPSCNVWADRWFMIRSFLFIISAGSFVVNLKNWSLVAFLFSELFVLFPAWFQTWDDKIKRLCFFSTLLKGVSVLWTLNQLLLYWWLSSSCPLSHGANTDFKCKWQKDIH